MADVATTRYSMLTAWIVGMGWIMAGPVAVIICTDCAEQLIRSMTWPPPPA